MTARRVTLAWLAALAAGLGACVVASDPPKADAEKADPLRPKDKDDALFAVAACATCHNSDPATPAAAKDHPFGKRYKSHEFILLSEGKTWADRDPHSQAFNALEGERGKKMGVALGYDPNPKAWTACLTCHAVDKHAGDSTLRTPAPDDKPAERFATAEGVTCVACHGIRKEWQSEHYAEPPTSPGAIPWKGWPVAEKQKHGMRDLRDPAVKAKLCASCHVGNAELNRVVTHDMFAAGHPPLPPFELATYLKAQPNHWAHPTAVNEKGERVLPYFKSVPESDRWAKFHFHEGENAAAREFAAGAVAAARAEAEMLAADAKKGDGIDYARFDCLACHHDLKTPSDRQARGYDGPPGRPPLRASVGVVAGVVAKHAKEVEAFKGVGEFEPKWDELRAAVTRRPFGDDTVAGKADAVRAWCDGFLAEQSSDPKAVYANGDMLRAMIADRVKLGIADPEAALALAWGYVAIGGKALPTELELRAADAKADAGLGYRRRQQWVNVFRTDKFTAEFGKLK